MGALRKKRLAIATTVYWFMLVYIVSALVWWFIELENQNREMTAYRIAELNQSDASYNLQRGKIESERKRTTTQFILEGATFLALIIIGAVYVYRVVRRQINMQLQQQNFMMAVTHELKTPIAVAQLNLETLQKHNLDEAKKQKLIQMTLQETNRLNHLASNVLVSAQLEGGGYRLSMEELDLSSLVSACVNDFIHRFPERNWVTEIEPAVEITGDMLLLQILVNNLLENALKYTHKGASIICRLINQSNHIFFQVIDDGPGIPDDEKKNIFEKFYRVGNEQTRSAKGTGLGLHLCKKIATDHNAKISVSDNNPTGSIFSVRFGRQASI
jgi:two-component system, OmpR family, sensor histidine kinase CiaH